MSRCRRTAGHRSHAVERRYQQGDATLQVLRAPTSRSEPGEIGGAGRRRPAPASRPCCTSPALLERPERRRGLHRRPATAGSWPTRHAPRSAATDRLRLPVPPPAAGVLGDRERHAAADDPRPRASARRKSVRELLAISASASGSPTGRRSCRAASSSGSPSRARSPMRRGRCWPTSRPAISIRTPPTTCSTRSRSWSERRASPR